MPYEFPDPPNHQLNPDFPLLRFSSVGPGGAASAGEQGVCVHCLQRITIDTNGDPKGTCARRVELRKDAAKDWDRRLRDDEFRARMVAPATGAA